MASIEREKIAVAGFDGARLTATLLSRPHRTPRALRGTPVVILPDHLRPASIFEPLARELLTRADGPDHVLLIDYRGRGDSAPRDDSGSYTPRAEAKDAVSLLDAMNWHHADIIGSSRGGLVSMCLTADRPALIRRLVLNDIGPELDGVGLARLRMLATRWTIPETWDDASELLNAQFGSRYPAVTADDRKAIVRLLHTDEDGSPASPVSPGVVEHFASIDSDERYPTLWPEFRALRAKPVLLLRAEHSDMLTDGIVERMKSGHPALAVTDVAGQGHAPFLHLGDLPEQIATFFA